jgi:hypothetical protein
MALAGGTTLFEFAAAPTAAKRGGNLDQSTAGTDVPEPKTTKFRRVDSNHDKRNQNPLSCH